MDRPQLDQLREAIPRDAIHAVLVFDLDRLARKAVYQMLLEEEFGKLGATIEYVNGRYDDSDEGRLQKHIKAAVAEYERAKILERVRRGKLGKAKQGKVVISTAAPYGYRKVGSGGNTTIEINEEEAQIVRLIYQWYTEGDESGHPLSVSMIGRRLDDRGVPLPTSSGRRTNNQWSWKTISKILKTETYSGTWYYNKVAYRKHNGKSTATPRPREEWIGVPVPAILDAATFSAARSQAALNRERSPRNRKHTYLFAGLIRCGLCQHTLTGVCRSHDPQKSHNHYYRCGQARAYFRHTRCYLPYIPEALLEAKVWDWIKQLAADPERALAALSAWQAEQEHQHAPMRERLALIDEKLIEADRYLMRVLDTHAKNTDLSPDLLNAWLQEQKGQIARQRSDLERERAELTRQLQQHRLLPDHVRNASAFLARLKHKLDDATPEGKRGTLESLDLSIRVTIEDGYRVAYATCVLAQREQRLVLTPVVNCGDGVVVP
jgi:site-specific DNA recombinase